MRALFSQSDSISGTIFQNDLNSLEIIEIIKYETPNERLIKEIYFRSHSVWMGIPKNDK